MKHFKKLLSLFTAIILIISSVIVSALTVSAAATINMTPDGTNIDITKNLTVKVNISATEAIMNTDCLLTFDAAQLQFLSAGGDYAEPIEAGKLKVFDDKFNDGEKTASYSFKFKALATGNISVTFSGMYVNGEAQGIQISKTVTFTANDPSLSNADLTSLAVSGANLSPAFSSATTNYTATVKYETDKITVNASAADGLTIEGGGNINLNVGDNKHTVTVTSKDGKTKKIYTINIKRLAEGEELTPETSEPETPNEDAPDVDVLQVQIGDKSYHILDKLPENTEAPAGFEIATAEYNGVTVPVFSSTNKEYTLFNLKNDDDQTVDFYTYDSIRDEFVLLPYMNINEKMFIFAKIDESLAAPVGYNESSITLGNSEVKVYTSEKSALSDFCVIYCFVDGKYKFYTYDLLEKTIQRTPEFELIQMSDTPASTTPQKPANWLQALHKISYKGKAVVFTLFVIAICVIALVIMLVIRAMNSRDYNFEGVAFEPDNEYDAFDDIELISDSDNNPQDIVTTPEEMSESAPEKD